MSDNDNMITPVNHTSGSAALHTAAGAGEGAVKSGFKWAAAAFVGMVVLGAVIGSGGLAALGLGVGGWVGAGLGAVAAALFVSPAAGALGGLLGGYKGGSKAHEKVANEKAAAKAMDMQLEAYKYNMMANAVANSQPTTVYAPSATNYVTPAQGSEMNQAMPMIGDRQYDGLVSGQQLQRA